MSTISQRSVRSRHIAGIIGALAVMSFRRNRITTGVNSDPQRAMSKTLTIDTYTDGADYVVTLEGRTITYTATTADANTTGVASSLAAAINSDPQVRGFLKATPAAAVITLEGLLPGLSFSAYEPEGHTLSMVLGTAHSESGQETEQALICVWNY